MNDQIDELKNLWKNAKKSATAAPQPTGELIAMAIRKKRKAVKMHMANILVLLITLIGISFFFIYVAHFKQFISFCGIALMTGGLTVRILIECWSIYLSSKIDLTDTALKTNSFFLRFYLFRKKVHSTVTIAILALYSIGFYLLTPEFSLYFSLPMMVVIDLSYVVAAIIFTRYIRQAIKKEVGYLNEIKKVQEQLTGENM